MKRRADLWKTLQVGNSSSGMDGEGVGVGGGRVGWEGEMQAAAILAEGDAADAGQLNALDWPREGGGSLGESLNEQLTVVWPDEGEGVEGIAFGDEANIFGGVGPLPLFFEGPGGGSVGRSFAEDGEGAGAVDRATMHLHPRGKPGEGCGLVRVAGAISAQGNAEE